MWWRASIALVIVLHAIVFAFLDPDSWLFEGGRTLYLTLGVLAAAGLAVGAGLLVAGREWWTFSLFAGGAVSLAQLLLFFEPGQFVGVAIDVAILAFVAWRWAQGREAVLRRASPA